MKRISNFTHIELLMFVAIIAILAAILLPSIMRAKAKATTVVCMGNTRQWGLATQMYLDDNNNKMARGAEGSDYSGSLGGKSRGVVFIRLAPYIGVEPLYPNYTSNGRNAYYKSSDIFRCPGKSYNEKALLDYSVNSLHFKFYYDKKKYAEAGYITAAGYNHEFNWPDKYINNLGDTILFADNHRPADLKHIYTARTQFFSGSHLPWTKNSPNLNIASNRMMSYTDKTHLGQLSMTAFDGSSKIISLIDASDWPDNDLMTGDWDK